MVKERKFQSRLKPAKISKNRRLQAYLLMNENLYRPEKDKRVIDLEIIAGMARIGATNEEIAAVLRVSVVWLEKEREHNPAMQLAMSSGMGELKQSLRRAQVDMALNGSAAMLIWLGKQHLGQSDKQVTDNNTTININVQRAMDELRTIPKNQLLQAHALLSAPPLAMEGEFLEIPDGAEGGAPPV